MNIVCVITVMALALALAVVLVVAFAIKLLIVDFGKAIVSLAEKYDKEYDDVLHDCMDEFGNNLEEDVNKLISKF